MERILFSLFLIPIIGYSQIKPVEIDVKMKTYRPNSDSEFIFYISIISHSKNNIYISKEPFYTASNSNFGDFKIEPQILDNGCFKKIDIDHDPGMEEILKKKNTIKVSYGDTIYYEYDIRDLMTMGKGVYRFRIMLSYREFKKTDLNAVSNWIYFEVPSDDFKHRLSAGA